MYLLRFTHFLIERFILNLMAITMKEQYHIDKNVGTVYSNIKIATSVFGLLLSLCSGLFFDTVGRRMPVFLGLICQSVGICIIPLFDQVGWFVTSRLLIQAGDIALNCPLIPDYIMEESHVLANSYLMMCISLASLLSSYLLRFKFKKEEEKEFIY